MNPESVDFSTVENVLTDITESSTPETTGGMGDSVSAFQDAAPPLVPLLIAVGLSIIFIR